MDSLIEANASFNRDTIAWLQYAGSTLKNNQQLLENKIMVWTLFPWCWDVAFCLRANILKSEISYVYRNNSIPFASVVFPSWQKDRLLLTATRSSPFRLCKERWKNTYTNMLHLRHTVWGTTPKVSQANRKKVSALVIGGSSAIGTGCKLFCELWPLLEAAECVPALWKSLFLCYCAHFQTLCSY